MNKLTIASLFFLSLTGSSMIIDNVDDIRADWRINSDRVMGGVSDVFLDELNDSDISFYRLSGDCLLYTSPSPRDLSTSRMPSSA